MGKVSAEIVEREAGQYDAWVEKKVREDALGAYVAAKNAASIDGLPAVSGNGFVRRA